MEDLKGIFALFTACLSLCAVLNFILFYKQRKVVADGLILAAMLCVNQLIEFTSSFWMIDNKILSFIYIMTFNFTISLSGFFLLKHIQPDSKQNWKAFMLSVMLLPAGFVYLSSFKLMTAGFLFTEYRYFASPMANILIGLIQTFFALYFLYKQYYSGNGIRKEFHYKLLVWCYTIPPLVFIAALLISVSCALYFESIYSKLLLLNAGSFIYYLVKQESYVRNNS